MEKFLTSILHEKCFSISHFLWCCEDSYAEKQTRDKLLKSISHKNSRRLKNFSLHFEIRVFQQIEQLSILWAWNKGPILKVWFPDLKFSMLLFFISTYVNHLSNHWLRYLPRWRNSKRILRLRIQFNSFQQNTVEIKTTSRWHVNKNSTYFNISRSTDIYIWYANFQTNFC